MEARHSGRASQAATWSTHAVPAWAAMPWCAHWRVTTCRAMPVMCGASQCVKSMTESWQCIWYSYLVNTARGAIMERDAVVRALESGHLKGYAGDVWCALDQSIMGVSHCESAVGNCLFNTARGAIMVCNALRLWTAMQSCVHWSLATCRATLMTCGAFPTYTTAYWPHDT